MKKALGILGGMGPLATADLFRKIVTLHFVVQILRTGIDSPGQFRF